MPVLNAPKQIVFIISLVLVALAVMGTLVAIPFVSAYAFWMAVLGYVLLAAGVALKGM
jgi:heme/copper-type cytochrome/quinol oxidase subunit 1